MFHGAHGRTDWVGYVDRRTEPFFEGSQTFDFFKREADTATLKGQWADLGLNGESGVRNMSVPADRDAAGERSSADVLARGVVLIRGR
jgi:hypothetical protein